MQRMMEMNSLPSLPAKLGALCVTLLMFVFYSMLVPLRIPEMDKKVPLNQRADFWRFTVRYTPPFALESIRALAICLLWFVGGAIVALILGFIFQLTGLLDMESLQTGSGVEAILSQPLALLLALIALGPLFFFYIRYFFVGYVVLTDPDYEAGKVNPLRRSAQVLKYLMIPMIVILLVFTGIDLERSNLREQLSLAEFPLRGFLVAILFELATIYANILLFEIYRLKIFVLTKGTSNGTHV